MTLSGDFEHIQYISRERGWTKSEAWMASALECSFGYLYPEMDYRIYTKHETNTAEQNEHKKSNLKMKKLKWNHSQNLDHTMQEKLRWDHRPHCNDNHISHYTQLQCTWRQQYKPYSHPNSSKITQATLQSSQTELTNREVIWWPKIIKFMNLWYLYKINCKSD